MYYKYHTMCVNIRIGTFATQCWFRWHDNGNPQISMAQSWLWAMLALVLYASFPHTAGVQQLLSISGLAFRPNQQSMDCKEVPCPNSIPWSISGLPLCYYLSHLSVLKDTSWYAVIYTNRRNTVCKFCLTYLNFRQEVVSFNAFAPDQILIPT